MTTDRLTAYIDGVRAGWFVRNRSGIDFTFDEDWRRGARRMELTLSMPKTRRVHSGSAPENFLWNLLPDNNQVLERWSTRFAVSARNPMALLEHVGLDTAGAVQLSVEDGPVLVGPTGFEPISETEIAEHIRQLRVDPEAWLLPGRDAGYFSLAGAQSKFALARTPEGQWTVPSGRSASTYILKPGIQGLNDSDLNEHLSLSAAGHLGLNVASSSIEYFEDQSAIVVTRYDRELDPDGTVKRLHQEDLAQATGVHPAGKYQNEGGPSVADIVRLIRRTRGKDGDSAQRFFDAVIFNWAILGSDAHAKNYSLLHDRERGPGLAPLYDVATALPYRDMHPRTVKLAMSLVSRF